MDIIQHIQQVGLSSFVDEQIAQPAVTQINPNDSLRFLFNNAVDGNSLLRLRDAWAIQTSIPSEAYANYTQRIPWEAKLEADAFGNYRQILLDALGDPQYCRSFEFPRRCRVNRSEYASKSTFCTRVDTTILDGTKCS